MIVQAIGLLDDLDKELNTYAMRVREWYGWHFPEMTKIVNDNIAYAKVKACSVQAEWSAANECPSINMKPLTSRMRSPTSLDMCCMSCAYVLCAFVPHGIKTEDRESTMNQCEVQWCHLFSSPCAHKTALPVLVRISP